MPKASGLGHHSSHGGVIISASILVEVGGIKVATVGHLHSCPIPGHGVTAIATGSSVMDINGQPVAMIGSVTGCGAVISEGFDFLEV